MIPTTVEGFYTTYTTENFAEKGFGFPIHFAVRNSQERIGEVYGSDSLIADLWCQFETEWQPGYRATFDNPTEAAQWVVNEYERRIRENDWR